MLNTCLLLSTTEFLQAQSLYNLLLPRLPQTKEEPIFLPLNGFTVIHGVVYISFPLSPPHSMDFSLVFYVFKLLCNTCDAL